MNIWYVWCFNNYIGWYVLVVVNWYWYDIDDSNIKKDIINVKCCFGNSNSIFM